MHRFCQQSDCFRQRSNRFCQESNRNTLAVELDALSGHAVRALLQAYAFGGNEYAQATGRGGRDVVTPQPCLPRLRVAQVAAGGMHSVALTDSGEVRPPPPSPLVGLDVRPLASRRARRLW